MRWMLALLLRILLKLRYRVRVVGERGSGFLLAGLSSEIDPLILQAYFYPARLILPEGLVGTFWIRWLLERFDPIRIPNLAKTGNPVKKRQCEELIRLLPKDESYLFFPSFRLRTKPIEGHYYLSMEGRPLSVHGTWGSIFSDRYVPLKHPMQTDFWSVVLRLLKNGIFFSPRREVRLAVEEGSAEEVLKRPEKLIEVPFYFWGRAEQNVQKEIFQEIARLAKVEEIRGEMSLYEDLGLSSLDVTGLIVFIEKRFHRIVSFEALHTVKDAVDLAEGKPVMKDREKVKMRRAQAWGSQEKTRPSIEMASGKNILEVFFASCDRMGSHIALADYEGMMTYERLKSIALGLEPLLKKLPGKRVGILLPPSGHLNALVFGLMLAGKVPVMLNYSLGPKHIEEVVQEGSIESILSDFPFLEQARLVLPPEVEEKIHSSEDIRAGLTLSIREKAIVRTRKSADELKVAIGEEDPALIFFTSGSEKKPKAVPLSHKNLLSNERAAALGIDFRSDDVLMPVLPAFHSFGYSICHLLPLLSGCRTVLVPSPIDFKTILQAIGELKATILCTTPTFLKAILSLAEPEGLASLRIVIVGAEKAPQELFEMAKKHSFQLLEGYGITECGPVLSMNRLGDEHRGVGFPLQGVEMEIVDPETHEPKDRHTQGLILARGPNIFSGYASEAPNPFVTLEGRRWYNTGDLGFFDHKGALHIAGRLSRAVKIGGELISLPSIEEALLKELKIKGLQIAVVGAPDGRLILFSNQEIDPNPALRQAGFSNLVKIDSVRVLEALPLLPSGKLNFRALQELAVGL